MQDAYPVCGFFEDRCQLPGTGFGGRPSALGLDKGGGKVVPPSPLIPPWPRAGYRGPSRGTGYLVPGTWYPAPLPPIPQTILNKALPLIPWIFIVPDDVKDGPASPAIIVGHG